MQLLFELPPKLVECFHGASLHGLGKARAARLHQIAQVALGGRQPMLLNGNHNHNHTMAQQMLSSQRCCMLDRHGGALTYIGRGGAGRELVEVEKRPKQYEGLGVKDQGSLASCIGT
jgi:hypothetical protein